MNPHSSHAANAEVEPGQQVGEYQIEGKLGEGGFGAVYRAVHPLIGKAAAIKVLNLQYSSNPEMVGRFVAEARAVNQIRHRNIIDIFSFGSLPDGRSYYVMELLEGMTLDQYVARHGRLSPEVALPILRQIARALDAAHAAGIAHRDLKPENIFLIVESDGSTFPKLLDFGIAKLLHEADNSSVKTRTGTPMGTPYYMSPEQIRGSGVDHRTDIYSFGVLTFQLLTGQLPFDAESVVDLLFKHIQEPPPLPSKLVPELPPGLDAPVLHMLEKDASRRPASLSVAVDELALAAQQAGLPVSLPGLAVSTSSQPAIRTSEARTLSSPDVPSPAGLPSSRASGPRGPALLAALALGAVVLGAGALYLRPSASPAASAAPLPEPLPSALPAASSAAPPLPVVSVVVPSASAAPAEMVELTLLKTPPATEIFLGAVKIGTAPGPLRFRQDSAPIKLTLKAAGHQPRTVEFVPLASGSLDGTLPRLKGAGRPGNVGDLEQPY